MWETINFVFGELCNIGIYINPTKQSKEDWLAENCEAKDNPLAFKLSYDINKSMGFPPVCLCFNSAFTSAAVCFSLDEMKAFLEPDWRVKLWYLVPIEKLMDGTGMDLASISTLHKYLKE